MGYRIVVNKIINQNINDVPENYLKKILDKKNSGFCFKKSQFCSSRTRIFKKFEIHINN